MLLRPALAKAASSAAPRMARVAVARTMTSEAAAAEAAVDAAAESALHAPAKVTTLSNGIRVATSASGGETATVGVWIDAGSRFENDENNGVAHFLEHMAFKGTAKRSQRDLEVSVENIGAHVNAYTSREQTTYFAKVMKEHVPTAVELLSDILTNATYSESHIEFERGVILREMAEVEKNLEEVTYDQLHATAFQGTSLARTILGPEENIRGITRQDLVDYVGAHYVGNRMVVAAAGAVDHDAFAASVDRAFGGVAPGETADAAMAAHPTAYTGSEVRIQDSDLPLAHVAVAVQGVSWSDPDYFAMSVMQSLLGSWDRTASSGRHLSSALARTVATDDLAHSISSFNMSFADTGLWGVYAVAERRQLDDLVFEVTQEWNRMAYHVTEPEVARARAQLKTAALMRLDGTTNVAEDVGRQVLTYGRRLSLAETFARIDAVTADEVRRVAGSRVYDTCPAVVAIGPVDDMPDYNRVRSWNAWFRV